MPSAVLLLQLLLQGTTSLQKQRKRATVAAPAAAEW
jgi:hypothetical protein